MTWTSRVVDCRCMLLLGAVLLHAPRATMGQEDGVAIVVGFDGSCPSSAAGVKQEGARRFRIFPSWRPSPGIDEEAVRERFVRFMPDQLQYGKEWTIRDPKPLSEKVPDRELLRNYCERNFGTVAVTFEFPWFGRTTDDMRDTGRQALWALLRALDPPPDGLR